jgi:precorrin-4/cobalt-precorrin-4 C11-methyltransferase
LHDIAGAVEAAGLRQAAVIMVGHALGRWAVAGDQPQSHLYSPLRAR